MVFLIYLIIIGIVGSVFGIATQNIIDNKGYDEKWFWWGFFFGFLAVLVALSKPENHAYQSSNPTWMQTSSNTRDEEVLKQGGWKCTCGRVNPSYTGTCACGKRKGEVTGQKQVHKTIDADSKFEEIKKYKELLDSGIITEEEFNKKKTELLGL